MEDDWDWRIRHQPNFRVIIVSKIKDTLKKHVPISGPDGLLDIEKIAVRFEEKIYNVATSQVCAIELGIAIIRLSSSRLP